MPDRQWISQSAEALVQALASSAAQSYDCDVLIVGSGYGAAVAAAHLAGARPKDGGDPIRLYVLERGVEYLPGTFPTRFADLPGHVRFSTGDGAAPRGRAEGLFDLRIGGATSVLVANGLGGGSLINAAVLAEPKAEAFAGGWPEGISLETLRPHYDHVRRELGGNDFAGSGFEPPKLTALFDIGRAMGAEDPDRFRATLAIHPADGRTAADVTRRGCLHCGDCVTGCNHAAKGSLDVTYLRKAHDLGAQLYCGATVHSIEPLDAGREGWKVQAFFTDRNKGYADASPCFTIRARIVVLGAGALGSTEILLRSAAALDAVNVGTRFSGNGDAIAIVEKLRSATHASAHEQQAPAERRIGPTINGMVFVREEDTRRTNPWLLFQEFAIPGALRRVLGEVAATVGLLQRLAQPDESTHAADAAGEEPEASGEAAIEHLAVIGMQGDDGAQAQVLLADGAQSVLSDGQVRIVAPRLDVYDAQLKRLEAGLRAEPALGGRVLPNPLWRPLPNLPLKRTVSVHPLGGCPMGDDPGTSALDPLGRVRRAAGDVHRTLVVLDGAAIPASLGANPALTIAALAERAMPLLMEDWALTPARWESPGQRTQPVWRDVSAAQPLAPTVVELRERLTGRLRLEGRDWDAALTMRSAPIADLHAFVHRLPRTLPLRQARLQLHSDDGNTLEAELSGRIHVLHRVASTAASRQAAVVQRLPASFATMMKELGFTEAMHSHVGEVRSIDYELVVESVEGGGATLRRGDRWRLSKRIAFEPGLSPWRQLSEADVWQEGAAQARPLGRLALDFGDLAQQSAPLLHVLGQQDQPNALGDLAALWLLALRLVVKTRLPSLIEALVESLVVQQQRRSAAELQQARTPGTVRWRDEAGEIVSAEPQRHEPGGTGASLNLFRYRPMKSEGRPVLLIHGLGASGSTFAHWSIGARADAQGNAAGAPLVAALLAHGREVWVVELRTSIAHAGPPAAVKAWTIEQVATGDIAPAIAKVLELSGDKRVDVVAHCIGAAMFCMAVLAAPADAALHSKIGAVVLSQVGPLMRLSPLNRFRGVVASYLKQFLSAKVFDVRPPLAEGEDFSAGLALLDALLSTFPYPDGDRARERNHDLPGFRVIRHRADAIWGRLMELDNVGDETLARLDEIYGFVAAETLAQTIHFARHSLITDAGGANRFVAQSSLAERFDFPVLLLHGRDNAMFDWQGSYDSLRLLKLAFGDPDRLAEQAPGTLPFDGDDDWPPRARAGVLGRDTPRQLLVLDGYGHQDCLIGRNAHHDVFPRIVGFLDDYSAPQDREVPKPPDPQLIAELPWLGPMFGWPRADADLLHFRVVLRASPARFATLGVAFVPAVRREGRWLLALDQTVVHAPVPEHWPRVPIDVKLREAALPQHDGFAVFTLHDDLPRRFDIEPRIFGDEVQEGLFAEPARGPSDKAAAALRDAVQVLGERIESGIVRLTPALIAGADGARAETLSFALASCQYPAGLLDREVAQASYQALAERLESGTAPLPQGLLMVGDQIYADEAAGLFEPAGGAGGFATAYERGLRLPALRAVARRLPLAAMLDDHEVRDDWEPLQPAVQLVWKDGLAAFAQFQHVLAPADARLDGTVFAYRLAPAGFPLLVLDSRTQREARSLRPGARGTPLDAARILPSAAIDAIDTWLAASGTGRPVFIVSPSLVFPFERRALRESTTDRLRVDAWSGFPASLVALFERIVARRPRELVFLSGDAHLSLVSSLRFTFGDSAPLTVHSIVSSGTYTPWPFANTASEDLLLDGELHYRLGGDEVLKGTIETPVVVRAPGVALIDVRRDTASGEWRLGVEFDRPDECVRCSRLLGTQGSWQVSRFRL